MSLQDEICAVRRGLDDVETAMRPLRERSAASRLVRRLEGDLRRAREDLDDLAAEAGPVPAQPAGDYTPVPVPPRSTDLDYDPECDDEGLSGSRFSPATTGSSGAGSRPKRHFRRHA
jgi:hypothetical protein